MPRLTRKQAIEKAVANGRLLSIPLDACAQFGVDYGIVLGLQMAATYVNKHTNYSGFDLRLDAAQRLKKLEKSSGTKST